MAAAYGRRKMNEGATFYFTLHADTPSRGSEAAVVKKPCSSLRVVVSGSSRRPVAGLSRPARARLPEKGLPREWNEEKISRGRSRSLDWAGQHGECQRPRVAHDGRRTAWHLAARDRVRCETGKEVVKAKCQDPHGSTRHHPRTRASPSPVIDGDRYTCTRRRRQPPRVAGARSSGRTVRLTIAAGAGGLADRLRRPADLQLRRSDVAFVNRARKHTGKTKWKTNRGYPAIRLHDAIVIRAGEQDQLISVGAFACAPTIR